MRRRATIVSLLLTAAALGGSAAVPMQAKAARAPDLIVSALKGAPASALIGKSFKVTVTIKNNGGKAGASTTRAYLGWDRKLQLGKVARLGGQQSVPRLGGGKTYRSSYKLKAPLDAPVDQPFYLVVCADDKKQVKESSESNNCKAAPNPITLQGLPTAYGLIDEALARGEIDEETALLYYAYAAAGDPRLPQQFDQPELVFDSAFVFRTIADKFDSLSPEAQLALDPFFSPPSYEGAYLPPTSSAQVVGNGWSSRQASAVAGTCAPVPGEIPRAAATGWASNATEHFRIWHFTADPGGLAGETSTPAQSEAAAVALAAIAEEVYTKETALWREPLPDGTVQCNGGDALIDVYLVRVSSRAEAQVVPYPPGSNLRPGWMWVAPDIIGSVEEARSYFAHEFAHLTQLAYNEVADPPHGTRIEYGWLEEASATWAMDYVYEDDNLEHDFLPYYFRPHGSIAWETPLGECTVWNCKNGYRDYLFFFFLTHKLNNPALMGDVWRNVESYDSIGAVDQALADFGLEWRDFVLHNMNRENYDQYKTWDGIEAQLPLDYEPTFDVTLEGKKKKTSPYPYAADGGTSIEPKTYRWVNFKFPDNKVRQITLKDFGYQPEGPVDENTRVTAWYKLANGNTGIEDLSDDNERIWCRDHANENLTELVIFYTEGRPTPYLEESPERVFFPLSTGKVIADRLCKPPQKFTGTFSGSNDGADNDRWDGTVTFQYDRTTAFDPDDRVAYYYYPGTGGSVTWEKDGYTDQDGCVYTPQSPVTSPIITGHDEMLLYIDREPMEYALSVSNVSGYPRMRVDINCPDNPNLQFEERSPPCCAWLYTYGLEPFLVGEGFALSGRADNGPQHWQWNFVPGSLPPPPSP